MKNKNSEYPTYPTNVLNEENKLIGMYYGSYSIWFTNGNLKILYKNKLIFNKKEM